MRQAPQHPTMPPSHHRLSFAAALRQLWQILEPREQRKAYRILAMVIVMALMEAAGVVSIVPFLAAITDPQAIQSNRLLNLLYETFGFSSERDFIIALGIGSGLVIATSSAFKAITQHALNRFSHLQLHSISSRLLLNYLNQPYSFFLQRNTSDLSKNILSETDQIVTTLIQPVVHTIAQGIIVLAIALLLLAYDARIATAVTVSLALMYGVIYYVARKKLTEIGAERTRANTERFKAANEALGGIKEIKIGTAAPLYLRRFNSATRTFARHRATNDTIAQTPLYIVEGVGYCGLIAIAVIMLWRTGSVSEALPLIGLYGFAAYRMLPAVQVIYRGVSRMRFSAEALTRLHHDLDQPHQPHPESHQPPIVPMREIRLASISYTYPTAAKPVFENFSLTLQANTINVIAGPSGSGKSTLMDILLGLLEPQQGTITVDETPITHDNLPAWQASIGYVPQHTYLFDGSIAENIAMGLSNDQIDMQAVRDAAAKAEIDHFISNELSSGYQTSVGERGIRLSGGQMQRIGIARALYRKPTVLILDEPTSALDEETDSRIMATLAALQGRITVVLVSHRPRHRLGFPTIDLSHLPDPTGKNAC
ncbi:ABC transporter ATP-binding protein [Pseudazoarcus pumilus]|nr:ABC transporter ATP-binding protein [Pseudazoarcus pumilus]